MGCVLEDGLVVCFSIASCTRIDAVSHLCVGDLYMPSLSLSLSLSLSSLISPHSSTISAKKLKKDKVATFSSPSRGKSGRGPGRPPKHPRVEETSTTSGPSDFMNLKVKLSGELGVN